MFISRLLCEHCLFSTEYFVDGYSHDSEAYTCVYRNVKTGEIRIVKVTVEELQRRNIDRKSADFDDILARSFALEDEVRIKFPSWGLDEQIDVPCPKCGASYLIKRVDGII